MEKISNSINYKKYKKLYPRYAYSKFTPNDGSNSATCSTSGGATSTFQLATGNANLSKAYLMFNLSYPLLATKYNWMDIDYITPIRNIQWYSQENVFPVDRIDEDQLSAMMLKPCLSLEKYKTLGQANDGSVSGNFPGICSFIQPADANVGGSSTANPRFDGSLAKKSLDENRYYLVSAAGATGSINIMLPLSMIVNSYFEVDTLTPLPTITYLKITWNSSLKMFHTGDSASNPSTAPVAAASSVSLSGLALYVPYNIEASINDEIDLLVRTEGVEIVFPYITTVSKPISGTQSTMQTYVNSSQGIRLNRIFSSVFNSTQSANTKMDHSNLIGTGGSAGINTLKITSYFSQLNGQRLQQFNVACTNWEDYMLHAQLLRGSMLLHPDEYSVSHFHLDDWTGDETAYRNIGATRDEIKGLDLIGKQYDYQIQYQMSNSSTYIHYLAVETTRILKITPRGFQME